VIIDSGFTHDERTRVAHVSMGADRLLPVLYERTSDVLAAARAAGFRVLALEDVGARDASELDLTGSVLFVVGGERDGIAPELLAQCDAVVRIPMAGFVPSYNLQGAVSALAAERLRQLRTV
jgi:tRNA G18 (ribose-2'-O)-methylase SpoU